MLILIGTWGIFSKAREHGWAILIPFYGTYTACKIAFGDGMKMFMLLIPIYNIIFSAKIWISIAEKFGKSSGFGVGLWLLPSIFRPILAFGSSTYIG